MHFKEMIALIENAQKNKNLELLNYFKSDNDYLEWWPVFAQWLVYETDGEGVSVIEQITDEDIAEEDFEDEVDNLMKLSPDDIIPKIPSDMMAAFKRESGDTLKELVDLSNTKFSFKLLSPNLLPDNTALIHYTDHPEEIASNGFMRGMPYISLLGETTRMGLSNTVGYNFAYLVNDKDHNYQKGTFKKKGYVKFKSSGVYVYHHGDGDNQVIFWGGYVNPTDIMDYGML